MVAPKFTVAICGGGVAGLAIALSLSRFSERKDIRVDLYEAAPSFTEIGAGIAISRCAWKALKALGLEDALRKLAHIPESDDVLTPFFRWRKSDQPEGVLFYHLNIPFGILFFHRAVFQQCLVEHLDPDVVRSHFSKRLVGYSLSSGAVSTPGRVALKFEDGSEARCDVLIGADGIRSATRHTMLELAAQEIAQQGSDEDKKLAGKFDPIWSGTVAYRALIPREKLEALNPSHVSLTNASNYTGKNKHIITYPINKGKTINVVAFVSEPDKEGTPYPGPWVSSREKSEITAAYEGWETEVQQLLQCIDNASRWAIHSMKELPVGTNDYVAIIGDAAHAMTPHQGSGAGTAIEDAYILGALLAHPRTTLSTAPMAFKTYETISLRHANDVQQRSRLQGQLDEYVDPRFSNLAGRVVSNTEECGHEMGELKALGEALIENWKWSWKTDPHDNLKEAMSMLVNSGIM